ncbi:penicillin-binding protein 1B [Chromatiaceae bacterium AAb-1]|nr:penicillin-binding protein 1B [Chromatiaceae bacterium AAb-1]
MSKTSKQPVKPARSFVRQAVVFGLKLLLLLLFVMVIYLIYLDSKVTQQFSGQKWQVPAQIYARSLNLYPGKLLTREQLITELEQLKYQRVSGTPRAGQYAASSNKVEVFRRPFTFVDGYESAARFSVEFNSSGINRILPLQQQTSPDYARLEPQLIEHLISPQQEDRELVQLERVPEIIKDTLLLVEDRNFYHHHGVSPLSVLRALWANLSAGRTVQGGSTLTQQLAKNMYLNSDRTLGRKINEALIALILEYRFSKDQLLEAYLNEIFIGQNHANAVHGFGLGSRFYFGKPLAELQPEEYALLIGMLKGPSYFDPRRYPQRAQQRRDLVLRLMMEQHLLTPQIYQQAVKQPLQLVSRGQHLSSGYPAYIDVVKKTLRQLDISSELQHSGIKVFTYLDPQAQDAAEQAVKQQLEPLDPELQAAVVVADYQQAEITAIVGGRDVSAAGFNRATDARRQIGSIIKPVIYLQALAQPGRFSLATMLDDQPVSLRSNNQDWQPQNFDQTFRGRVNLLTALSESLNVPTVRLGLQLGMSAVSDGLRKLGLNRNVRLHPAALLGAVELSPLEVAQLYQTIANNGVYQPLAVIQAVTDQQGNLLYQRNTVPQMRYNPEEMYLLQYALIQATQSGTARMLRQEFPGKTFAGKTGTSSDYRDSWFSGFDQNSLLISWLGRDDNKPIGLTGSSGALRIFSRYFKQYGSFSLIRYRPDRITLQAFSGESGYPSAQNCFNVLLLPAISVEMPVSNECEK